MTAENTSNLFDPERGFQRFNRIINGDAVLYTAVSNADILKTAKLFPEMHEFNKFLFDVLEENPPTTFTVMTFLALKITGKNLAEINLQILRGAYEVYFALAEEADDLADKTGNTLSDALSMNVNGCTPFDKIMLGVERIVNSSNPEYREQISQRLTDAVNCYVMQEDFAHDLSDKHSLLERNPNIFAYTLFASKVDGFCGIAITLSEAVCERELTWEEKTQVESFVAIGLLYDSLVDGREDKIEKNANLSHLLRRKQVLRLIKVLEKEISVPGIPLFLKTSYMTALLIEKLKK